MSSARSKPSRRRTAGVPPALVVAIVISAIGLGACSTLLGLDDIEMVACLRCDGGTGGDDASPESSTGDDAGCPVGRGPIMANVGDFCVDTTEVTNAQYAPFYAVANAGNVEQPKPMCDFNTNFHVGENYPWPGDPNDPVRGLDWCDAYAYCRWAGKRLCGSTTGGPSAFSSYAKPTNQWYVACSSNGANTYTFGEAFDTNACNGAGNGNGEVAHVTAFPRCHPPSGPFAAIYDMTGNVLEWEDSCESSAPDANCLTRGGWAKSLEVAHLACNHNGQRARNADNQGVGIRCCSP